MLSGRLLTKLSEKALAEPDGLPAYARRALAILVRRLAELTEEIGVLDRELGAWHAQNEASQRLAAIPGIGMITATAIAATVTDPKQFRSPITPPIGRCGQGFAYPAAACRVVP